MEEIKKQKTTKQLERYFKGAANHRRIEICCLSVRENVLRLKKLWKLLALILKLFQSISGVWCRRGWLIKNIRAGE